MLVHISLRYLSAPQAVKLIWNGKGGSYYKKLQEYLDVIGYQGFPETSETDIKFRKAELLAGLPKWEEYCRKKFMGS